MLACHPAAPSRWVHSIHARLQVTHDGALALTFSLEGDLDRLRIPPPRPPRQADGLWQHTCFEAFVAAKGETTYHEFNFAPSGEWAAYRFRSYRDGEPLEDAADPQITVRSAPDRLELAAVIRLECLPATKTGARLWLALSAVLEDREGNLSYWALRHPPGMPDFHHADGFALELDPLDQYTLKDQTSVEKR